MDELDNVASESPEIQAGSEAPVGSVEQDVPTDGVPAAAPVAAEPGPFFSYQWLGKEMPVMTKEEAIALALDGHRFRSGSSQWGREKPQYEDRIRSYEQQLQRVQPILPLLDREDVQAALMRASYGMPLEFNDESEPPPAFLLPLIQQQQELQQQLAMMTQERTRGAVEAGVGRFVSEHPNLTDGEKQHLAEIYGEIARGNPEASTAEGVYKLYNYALRIAGGAANGGGMAAGMPPEARQQIAAQAQTALIQQKKKEAAASSIAAMGSGVVGGEGPPKPPKEKGDAALRKYAADTVAYIRRKSSGG